MLLRRKVLLQAVENERPRLRHFDAHCGRVSHIIVIGFCFLYAIESNDSKGFRRSSIESCYVFSARQIATVGHFNCGGVSWDRFKESLETFGIGYLINVNHNVNWRLGSCGQTLDRRHTDCADGKG